MRAQSARDGGQRVPTSSAVVFPFGHTKVRSTRSASAFCRGGGWNEKMRRAIANEQAHRHAPRDPAVGYPGWPILRRFAFHALCHLSPMPGRWLLVFDLVLVPPLLRRDCFLIVHPPLDGLVVGDELLDGSEAAEAVIRRRRSAERGESGRGVPVALREPFHAQFAGDHLLQFLPFGSAL